MQSDAPKVPRPRSGAMRTGPGSVFLQSSVHPQGLVCPRGQSPGHSALGQLGLRHIKCLCKIFLTRFMMEISIFAKAERLL